jgi:hypothetical protein
MTKLYCVTSDKLRGYARGEIVTEQDVPGCNIVALVASGHLQLQDESTTAEQATETEDETE